MIAHGPVQSRRLGRSVVVHPVPSPVCSYFCVYCSPEQTRPIQVTRESFLPREQILAEVERVVEAADHVDYITFVGPGEPTLCADLGWLVEQCRRRWSLPVAVMTNGSLLIREDVRADLQGARVVLTSLDAASPEIFNRINRPHGAISLRRMLDGLIALCLESPAQIWIDVTLVEGLNDREPDLWEIALVIDEVQPDRVYLVLPSHAGARPLARFSDPRKLLTTCTMLGGARLLPGPDSGAPDCRPGCCQGEPASLIGDIPPNLAEETP